MNKIMLFLLCFSINVFASARESCSQLDLDPSSVVFAGACEQPAIITIYPSRALAYFHNKIFEEKYAQLYVPNGTPMDIAHARYFLVSERFAPGIFDGAGGYVARELFGKVPAQEISVEDSVRAHMQIVFPVVIWELRMLAKTDECSFLNNFNNFKQSLFGLVSTSDFIRITCAMRKAQYVSQKAINQKVVLSHIRTSAEKSRIGLEALASCKPTLELQTKDTELDALWEQTPSPTAKLLVECGYNIWVKMLEPYLKKS